MEKALSARILITEAMLYLLLARVALICFPFRFIAWYLNRSARGEDVQGDARKVLVRSIRRAIFRASHLLPVKMVCFPKAIAAYAMLRRRNVGTILYYGAVTTPDNGLMSHAWVQDGKDGVVGLRVSVSYKIIAKYPQQLLS